MEIYVSNTGLKRRLVRGGGGGNDLKYLFFSLLTQYFLLLDLDYLQKNKTMVCWPFLSRCETRLKDFCLICLWGVRSDIVDKMFYVLFHVIFFTF